MWRLCRLAVEAALIGAVSVFTVWYAVTKQMEEIWKTWSLSPPDVSFDLTQYMSALARQAAPFFSERGKRVAGAVGQAMSTASSPSSPSSAVPGGSPSPTGSGTAVEPTGTGDARPVWNAVTPSPVPSPDAGSGPQSPSGSVPLPRAAASAGPTADRPAVAVTEKQLLELRERLSDADRERMFNLLASRLSPDEIERIAGFFEDGLTSDELEAISRIVESRLSAAEYAELTRLIRAAGAPVAENG